MNLRFAITICLLVCGPSVLVATGENFVPNPSVETGDAAPDSWRFSNWKESRGEWDTSQVFDGKRSLRLSGRNGGWTTTFSVKPEVPHSVSFSYRHEGKKARVVTYVRETPTGKSPLLYRSERAISSQQKSGFVDGQFVNAADENGWVQYDAGVFVPSAGVESVSLLVKLVSEVPDSQLWLDAFRVEASPLEDLPDTAALLQQVSGAAIWTEDVNRKILIDQPLPSRKSDGAITLDLARGERGVFQIAVRPSSLWKTVNWTWSDFAKTDSGQTAGKISTQCRRVEYVRVDDPLKPFGRAGLHPDALTNRLPCDILAESNQTFWFDVNVPSGQAAGNYSATLNLTRGDDQITSIPVRLRVRSFSLPARPSMDVVARFNAAEVRAIEGDNHAVIKRYYESYFNNRTRCAVAAPIGVRLRGNTARIDADRFVQHAQHLRSRFGVRPLFLPIMWIGHDHHRMPVDAKWKGLPIFANEALDQLNPDFEQSFRSCLGQLVARLKAENLFDEPVVRFIDEPVLEDLSTRTGIRTLCKLIKSIAPKISISVTTTAPHLELFDVVDQWVLHTDAWNRSLPQISAARKAGGRIAVYNNAIAYLEQERIRVRLWPWLLHKYDVDGTYSWCGTTNWKNRMADPWNGGHSYFEVLFYPPRGDEQGPIESVRWALLHQGLQDYEYLQLAEKLAEQCKAAGRIGAAKSGHSTLAAAMQLVDRWPRVRPANDRPYIRDVTRMQRARTALADAIETMVFEKQTD